ncbi:MAG: PAS domain S-box protein [Deltaproteobacteria bacterium]|nr:PAS domain S-box protein [Deltaproteobacteria bacterium]
MNSDPDADQTVFAKFEELRGRIRELEQRLEQRDERIKAQSFDSQTLWSLVEALDEGVLEIRSGTCVRANSAAARMLGALSGNALVGTPKAELLRFDGAESSPAEQADSSTRRRLARDHGSHVTVVARPILLPQVPPESEFWLLDNEEPLEELRRACDLWAARYRGVTSALFEGMCIFKDGRILEVNPALCAMFGYAAKEAIGTDPLRYFPADVHEDLRAKAMADSPRPCITRAKRKDGTLFHVEISGRRAPFMHADWSFVVIRDVNDMVLARARLQETLDNLEAEVRRRTDELTGANETLRQEIERHHESTRHLRHEQNLVKALLDNAPFAISFKDVHGRYVRVNSAQAHWLGIEDGHEALGRTDADFVPAPTAARIRKNEELILQTGDAKIDAIERGQFGGKETVWLATTVLPWHDSHGKMVGTISISRDVSAVKKAEDALRASEERFRTLAENSRDTIMRFDRECRHLYVNSVVEEQTGIAPGLFIGRTHSDLGFPADLVNVWEDAIRATFRKGDTQRVEFRLPSGIWIDWLLMPEIDSAGRVQTVLASARNITDSRESLSRIARSESFLRALIENLPDFIGVLDENDRYIYLNRVAAPDAKIEDVLGKPVGVFTRPGDRPILDAALASAKSGVAAHFEIETRIGDVEQSWLSRFIPFSQDGQARVMIISTDVTAERNARIAQAESETRFRSLVENSPDHVVIADGEMRLQFVNAGELASTTDVLGQSIERYIDEADRPAAIAAFRETFENGVARELELRAIMRDGTGGWYLARMAPMKNNDTVTGVVILLTDIRETKSREADLRTFQRAVEQSLHGIAVVGLDGRISFSNPAWDRMHGFEPGALADVNIRRLHTTDQWNDEVLPFLHVVNDTGAHTGELGRVREGDGAFPSLTTISNVLGADGEPVARIVIAQDDTERRATLEDLRSAFAKAREADLLKGRFLANMSHELRTPLNAVIGLVEVLELEPGMNVEKRSHYTTLIRRAAQSLLLIVNNLLKLSKIEAGKYTPEPTRFPLRGLVEDIFARYEPQASAKSLGFSLDFGPGVPEDVEGDPVMLELVLNNLIGNAIKFTGTGGVTLAVSRAESGEERMRFEIVDTGIGIAAEHLPHIFDAFYQADDSTTRAYQGTGLGLAITREFVELMGGAITARSEEGRGSRFAFEIDLDSPNNGGAEN